MKQLLLLAAVLLNSAMMIAQPLVYTTPEKEGWTLTRTSTLNGVTVKHYEKGDKEVRTFVKRNGDFITTFEDENGLDKEPGRNSFGAYCVTLPNGLKRIYTGEDGHFNYIVEWTNGYVGYGTVTNRKEHEVYADGIREFLRENNSKDIYSYFYGPWNIFGKKDEIDVEEQKRLLFSIPDSIKKKIRLKQKEIEYKENKLYGYKTPMYWLNRLYVPIKSHKVTTADEMIFTIRQETANIYNEKKGRNEINNFKEVTGITIKDFDELTRISKEDTLFKSVLNCLIDYEDNKKTLESQIENLNKEIKNLRIDLNNLYKQLDAEETKGPVSKYHKYYDNGNAILLGDRLCKILTNDKGEAEFDAYKQKVGDKFYYALETDAIVNIEKVEEGEKLNYSNGDHIVLGTREGEDYIVEGKAHRDWGELRIKNGKARITLNNGTIMSGSALLCKHLDNHSIVKSASDPIVLTYEKIKLWAGEIQLPDGTIDEVREGQSRLEEKRKEQAEARAENAEYQKYVKKYGKATADALKVMKVFVGMSFNAVKEGFRYNLISSTNYGTTYKLYGRPKLSFQRGMIDCKITVSKSTGKITNIYSIGYMYQ